jgi:hypothetical protein
LIGSAFDDNLTGDAGANELIGGNGNDVLVWDALDTIIDGGAGSDTLKVTNGTVDLTTFAGSITGFEVVDLTQAGPHSVTLTAADVLAMSDTDILTVDGSNPDSIDAGNGWTDGGAAGGYHTYTQVIGADTATLIVDTNVSVNGDILL